MRNTGKIKIRTKPKVKDRFRSRKKRIYYTNSEVNKIIKPAKLAGKDTEI